jgi:hypothetical protein
MNYRRQGRAFREGRSWPPRRVREVEERAVRHFKLMMAIFDAGTTVHVFPAPNG